MPKVSVLVQTYNHAPYIQACLEGILNQTTSFDVEILVHDDASTDGTSDIVREFAQKHPAINAWIQTVNQFKLGHNAMELNATRARGDYLAICDGDDQWTDPQKLQRQVQILDQDPSVSLVVHAFEKVLAHRPSVHKTIRYPHPTVKLSDMIAHPGCYFSYSTFMFRARDLDFGEPYRAVGVTDIPRLLYSLKIGTVVYVDTVMSWYRQGVPNSYSFQNMHRPHQLTHHLTRLIAFFTWFKTQVPEEKACLEQRLQHLQLLLCSRTQDRRLRKQLTTVIQTLSLHDRFVFELAYWAPYLHTQLSVYRRQTHL
jgi:glycosyltransferase involved in cell wall biosynthesis